MKISLRNFVLKMLYVRRHMLCQKFIKVTPISLHFIPLLIHYNVGSFLTELLTPLTHNEFVLKDYCDAAAKNCNIPAQLFDNGYIFVLFDVTSLLINVLLNRKVNIILDHVYNENLLNTNLKLRRLKKVIKDTCIKTVFVANKKLYQQTDGI